MTITIHQEACLASGGPRYLTTRANFQSQPVVCHQMCICKTGTDQGCVAISCSHQSSLTSPTLSEAFNIAAFKHIDGTHCKTSGVQGLILHPPGSQFRAASSPITVPASHAHQWRHEALGWDATRSRRPISSRLSLTWTPPVCEPCVFVSSQAPSVSVSWWTW